MIRAFTLKAKARMDSLRSTVCVTPYFDPSTVPASERPVFRDYIGLWDTGATRTMITQRVVTENGLQPTGFAHVNHAHGTAQAQKFMINVGLPNSVMFHGVQVTMGVLSNFDVLIGMDIISQGDFAVTNFQGKTAFTYRTPSAQILDFNPTANVQHAALGRNDPCPCGSGRKFKKCCGI